MTNPPRRRRIAGERRRPSPLHEPAPLIRDETPPVRDAGDDGAPERSPVPGRGSALPRGRHLIWFVPVVAVAVASLVLVAIAATGYLGDRREADAVAQAGSDATSAATTAAESILSYEYTTVGDDITQSEELMTDDFADEYDKIRPTVEKLAEQRKLKVAASARSAALLECGEDCSATEARILMFVDQTRTSDGDPLSSAGLRTVFTMSKVHGSWLVSDFESQ